MTQFKFKRGDVLVDKKEPLGSLKVLALVVDVETTQRFYLTKFGSANTFQDAATVEMHYACQPVRS